jgi:hypothetical protein
MLSRIVTSGDARDARYPPFCADVGPVQIKPLAAQIWN